MVHFKNRADGGRQLAGLLKSYKGKTNVIVVGLVRGGAVTAAEVSDILHLPLDFVVVRKIGLPGEQELAIGALAEDGVFILNQDLIKRLAVPESRIKSVIDKEQQELTYRLKLYRSQIKPIEVKGKTVIVVDDGIATGATMEAAIKVMRQRGAARVVAATPVLGLDAVEPLQQLADSLVFLEAPADFWAIGQFYDDFHQLEHDEVLELLKQARNKDIKKVAEV